MSSPKLGHTTGGSGRSGARRGGGAGRVGQDGTPTERFAQETAVPCAPQGAIYNCLERPFRSTNNGNPPHVNRWTLVDDRLISGLSAGPDALFFPGYGRCGGSRYLRRELLRMKATEGAPPILPSPPPFSSPHTSPFCTESSSLRLNDSWKVCGLGFSDSWKD